MRVDELDTPALLIDLDIMERNLQRVADYAREHGLRLRPHTKTHKIPALGRRQLDLGAVGLTVAKVGEAQVMMRAAPPDLLVAYPVIGERKLSRLVEVARGARVTVSLDSEEAARQLSGAATQAGVQFGVLVEMDAGLGRVGVAAGLPLRTLAKRVDSLPGLDFSGVAFYPGHIKSCGPEIDGQLRDLGSLLEQAISDLRSEGLNAAVVSGGSTPTLFRSHEVKMLNEIRPGTYIFNDRNSAETGLCKWEDCAASILAAVVSTAVPHQVIIDGGSKTFSSDSAAAPGAAGYGRIREAPDAVLRRMNEEHGYVDMSGTDRRFRIGDRVHVIPNHVCVAMNLQERVYGVRGENVEQVWEVEARGKLQ